MYAAHASSKVSVIPAPVEPRPPILLTDAPLVCDDTLISWLDQLGIRSVVLSENLLKLWRISSSLNPTTLQVLANLREAESRWRYDAERNELVAKVQWLIMQRSDENACSLGGCERGVNTAARRRTDQSSVVRIVPASMLVAHLEAYPGERVAVFDQPHIAANPPGSNLGLLFCFTGAEKNAPLGDFGANADDARGMLRSCAGVWDHYLDHEALLPETEPLFRMPLALEDPQDSLFWRRLLASLMLKRDTRGCVLVVLSGLAARGHPLDNLRFKRFAAFFVRVHGALCAEGLERRCTDTSESGVRLLWTMHEQSRPCATLEATFLSWYLEHTLAVAAGWRNTCCYRTAEQGCDTAARPIGCHARARPAYRINSETTNNVLGVLHGTLLLDDVAGPTLPAHEKLLIARSSAVISRHKSGMPVYKFCAQRTA